MESGRVDDIQPGGRDQASGLKSFSLPIWAVIFWLVLAVLAVVALRSFPLEAVWDAITRLSFDRIGVLLALNLWILGVWTWRWQFFLSSLGVRFSFLSLLAYRLAGFGASYYTPGPQFGGEPYQVYLLSSRQNVKVSLAAASVYLDKAVEVLTNWVFLIFGLIGLFVGGVLSTGVTGWLVGVLFGLAGVVLVHLMALTRGKRPLTRFFETVLKERSAPLYADILRKTREVEASLGTVFLQRPRVFLIGLGISVFAWLVMGGEFFFMLRFLGVPVTLFQMAGVLTAVRIAFLLPSPAGIGTLELSLFLAMQAVGIDPAYALAASLLIRARDMTLGLIGLILGGSVSIWGSHIKEV